MKQRVYKNQTVPKYFTLGTADEDLSSPETPFQGIGVAVYRQDQKGDWAMIQRDGDGKPMLGYLAKEITESEFKAWEIRIKKTWESPTTGYMDSTGHWFPGNLKSCIITASANAKFAAEREDGFYSYIAEAKIDELADSKVADAGNRKEEYELRYQEAKDFQSNPSEQKARPFLNAMTYKGLSLEDGADVVVAKYEKAKADQVTLATLRMKKNLLKMDIPRAEKRLIYSEIINGLNAL